MNANLTARQRIRSASSAHGWTWTEDTSSGYFMVTMRKGRQRVEVQFSIRDQVVMASTNGRTIDRRVSDKLGLIVRHLYGEASDELWSVAQVAEHFGVSESRARAILADYGVERVTGYPAEMVRAIQRPGQGHRTDLEREHD